MSYLSPELLERFEIIALKLLLCSTLIRQVNFAQPKPTLFDFQ